MYILPISTLQVSDRQGYTPNCPTTRKSLSLFTSIDECIIIESPQNPHSYKIILKILDDLLWYGKENSVFSSRIYFYGFFCTLFAIIFVYQTKSLNVKKKKSKNNF